MIIKKIKAFRYGKLKNVNLEFKNGINVIYGENEAGKSTIQSFIKASFFGVGNKRTKDIKQNERTKIIPFNESTASGELEFQYEGKNLIIDRTFGVTKKEDLVRVVDSVTGEEQENLSFQTLGEKVLNISWSTFENTVFIKQLGTVVTKSKDDEIMTKITGMFQAGGDDVSFDKSIQKLIDLKKSIVTSRKAGSLDLLRIRLSNLMDERYKRIKLSEENVEDELKQIDLRENKEFLLKEIRKLELYKKYLKKTKLQNEYKDIMEYLKKSQELKNNKERMDEDLRGEEGQITSSYVEELEEELDILVRISNSLDSKFQEKAELEELICEKEKELQQLSDFNDLPEDIEQKILKVNLENENLKEKLRTIDKLKEEIKLIDLEIDNNLSYVNGATYLEERREDIDEVLKEYENELRYIESLLINEKSVGKKSSKNKIDKLKRMKYVCGGSGTIFVLCGIVILMLPQISNILGIVSMLLGFGGFVLYLKFKENLQNTIKANDAFENHTDLISQKKEHIDLLESNIDEICEEIKVNNYKELMIALNKFDKMRFNLQVLREKRKDKESFLETLGESSIGRELKDNQQAIDMVFVKTGCQSIKEFTVEIKDYKMKVEELSDLKSKESFLLDSIEMIEEDKNNKSQAFKKKMSIVKISYLDYKKISEELQKLKEKISLKHEIEISLKNTEETYKVLLKDRDLNFMEKEIQEIIDNDISYSYESEDEIENELKEKNKELLETEKSLRDVENAINTIFLGSRELYLIEEDIINVKKEIQNQEENLQAIEIATEVINESFKDMQKNFGPILNKNIGEYMSFLTAGKYKSIKVSENYNLSLRSEVDNSLVVAELLSNGTWDQIYLSLRLALIDFIFGDEIVPIILDEAFVQYDDNRMKRTMDLLYKIKEKRQIIIFTCQKREVEYLKNYEDVNIINL